MRLLSTHGRCRRAAFTLVEMLVAFGLATLFVVWVIEFASITFTQGIYALGNYTDLNTKSRVTLDRLSQDIRSASQMSTSSLATNSISLTNLDGTAFSYTWDGSNTVTRTYGGLSTVMLTNCDYLSFYFYQRNPSNGFTFVSTTNPSLVKLINVSWRCSRSYLGSKLNTESVQTAWVVIRN